MRRASPEARALSICAVAHIRHAAPLHDVGKIAIPDSILLKPGRLFPRPSSRSSRPTPRRVRACSPTGTRSCSRSAESIARSHHERWDGTGYPDALAGEAIPLVGRSCSRHVFDVLVHERPYKDAFSVEDAALEIAGGAGSQFDPGIVEAFTDLGARVWLAAPGVYGG